MIRDMDFIREALLDVEKNAKPLGIYCISYAMTQKGYEDDYTCAQIELMADAGFFIKADRFAGVWNIFGLSNRGYDFLETIKNESVWQQTKDTLDKNKLPKTLDWIAQIAGIFLGKFIKNLKG